MDKNKLYDKNKIIKCSAKKVLTLALLGSLVVGCGKSDQTVDSQGEDKTKTKIVLTMGFGDKEVFRISDSSCTKPEIMVYLTNMQNEYEAVYGSQIWDAAGGILEEKIKDTVIARMAQVKTMALLADSYGVSLDKDEKEKAKQAADAYYDSLDKQEKAQLDIDKSTIGSMYEELALAGKVYDKVIADVNPEISDDEARTITVQQILVPDKQTAIEIAKRAQEGEDFEVLAQKYSKDPVVTTSFGKGQKEEAYEKTAFDLDTEEISGAIETSKGYYILRCMSAFDQKQTDANKEKIVTQRKTEAFNEVYNGFVNGLTKNINEELWNDIHMIRDDAVKTDSFFQIYEEYMG